MRNRIGLRKSDSAECEIALACEKQIRQNAISGGLQPGKMRPLLFCIALRKRPAHQYPQLLPCGEPGSLGKGFQQPAEYFRAIGHLCRRKRITGLKLLSLPHINH
jgi:hypothetical protein